MGHRVWNTGAWDIRGGMGAVECRMWDRGSWDRVWDGGVG